MNYEASLLRQIEQLRAQLAALADVEHGRRLVRDLIEDASGYEAGRRQGWIEGMTEAALMVGMTNKYNQHIMRRLAADIRKTIEAKRSS